MTRVDAMAVLVAFILCWCHSPPKFFRRPSECAIAVWGCPSLWSSEGTKKGMSAGAWGGRRGKNGLSAGCTAPTQVPLTCTTAGAEGGALEATRSASCRRRTQFGRPRRGKKSPPPRAPRHPWCLVCVSSETGGAGVNGGSGAQSPTPSHGLARGHRRAVYHRPSQ